MSKCPNCPKKGQRHRKCIVCQKEGCEGCFTFLFGITNKRKMRLQNVYSCSQNCIDILTKNIEEQTPDSMIKADGPLTAINALIENLVLKAESGLHFNDYVNNEIQNKNTILVFFHPMDYLKENQNNPLWKNLSKYAQLVQARHYETMREFENAAQIYKSLEMYEAAGRVRGKKNELIIKKTNISVDLNSLLEQIKAGGIVAVYRCPHCSATLKISNKTNSGSLRTCEHCGNEIEAMDLAEFLKTALS
jgi:hypothetical protein